MNIHYGVYVGGQGDFSELFLGHGEWLRGCLGNVVYNGVNILQRARHRAGKSDAQSITWNCAAEFDANIEQDISFVEEGAYIALPNIINRTGIRQVVSDAFKLWVFYVSCFMYSGPPKVVLLVLFKAPCPLAKESRQFLIIVIKINQ